MRGACKILWRKEIAIHGMIGKKKKINIIIQNLPHRTVRYRYSRYYFILLETTYSTVSMNHSNNHHRSRNYRGRGGRGGRRGGHYRHHNNNNNNRNHEMPPPQEELMIGSSSSKDGSRMRIAVVGCVHGELDKMYHAVEQCGYDDVDLILCCGDVQSVRNVGDLTTMAIPPKYRQLGTFPHYYHNNNNQQQSKSILTIVIGGNHEASGYLSELPFGGWIAPNIYYLGLAGVIQYRGLRIAGISGIYNSRSYHQPMTHYTPTSLKSIYHVRSNTVDKLSLLSSLSKKKIDIFLSHDWPQGIYHHGDTSTLLRKKPFFRQEVQSNTLGSPANTTLLQQLKPTLWLSAHLHVKFMATYPHSSNHHPTTTSFVGLESSSCTTTTTTTDLTEQMTQFLSLDKCLPRRSYLQILNVPCTSSCTSNELQYDLEWLTILQQTHYTTKNVQITNDHLQQVRNCFHDGNWNIPHNFQPTVSPHATTYQRMGNPQTDALLQKLNLPHIHTIPYTTPLPPPLQHTSSQPNNNNNNNNYNNNVLIPSQTLTTNNATKPIQDENEIDLEEDVDLTMTNQSSMTITPTLHPVDDENEIDLEDDIDVEEDLAKRQNSIQDCVNDENEIDLEDDDDDPIMSSNFETESTIPTKRTDIQNEISTQTQDQNEIDLDHNEEESNSMNRAKKLRMDKNE